MAGVHYFGGYDTAAAQSDRADNAAAAILRAAERPGVTPDETDRRQPSEFDLSFVYARVLRDQSAGQQSGFVHLLQDRFGCSGWVLDGGGGGLFVKKELRSPRQIINGSEQPRTPLITRDDNGVTGRAIVSIFRPKDPGIETLWPSVDTSDGIVDFMHTEFKGALDAGLIAEPRPLNEFTREELDRMGEERRWILRNLEAGRKELLGIRVAVKDDGTEIRTRNGFRQFSSSGRKDIAYAKIYAYVAFLVWIGLGASGAGVASDMGDGIVGD